MAIPIEKMIIETDCPFQLNKKEVDKSEEFKAVVYKRKVLKKDAKEEELNEPKFLRVLIEYLASVLKRGLKDLADILIDNTRRAFLIK